MIKISTITACLNSEDTIEHLIKSYINQTYDSKELIIIDGGSTDNTLKIINKYSEHIDYYISQPDTGIYNAWNKGIKYASGEWISFIGSDDYFYNKNSMEMMAVVLNKVAVNTNIAYAKTMLVDNTGKSIFSIGKPWEESIKRFYAGECLPHPAVMHNKELFVNKLFDESYKIAGDYEFLLSVLKNEDALYIPDLIYTSMRVGGISSNPDNALTSLKEVRRAQKSHGMNTPSIYWLRTTMLAYIKRLLWITLGDRYARHVLDLGRCMLLREMYWTRR